MGGHGLPCSVISSLATASVLLGACCCFCMRPCTAGDSLRANQQLANGQTLVSAAARFELGFFVSGRTQQRYLGIWYKNRASERTIVWVANRDVPVTSQTAALVIDQLGRLAISDVMMPGVSSNLTDDYGSKNVSARLLDSGNLELRDESSQGGRLLWQSFDHPTDTLLPGMKIGLYRGRAGSESELVSWREKDDPSTGSYSLSLDQKGRAEVVISQSGMPFWISGVYGEGSFSSIPVMGSDSMFHYIFESNDDERYFSYEASSHGSYMSRLVLDYTGQIIFFVWSEVSQKWLDYWRRPMYQCEVYNQCGAFGSCVGQDSVSCECLKGFEPASPKNWVPGDWSGGCARRTPLKCSENKSVAVLGDEDKFLKILNIRLPANSQSLQVHGERDCKDACLNMCSCTAYSYGSGCNIWNDDLLNLQLSNDFDVQREYFFLRLAASELHKEIKFQVWKIVVIIVSISFLLVVAGIYIAIWRTKGPVNQDGKRRDIFDASMSKLKKGLNFYGGREKEYPALPLFSFSSLAAVTNNFSDANVLGKGGFGPVYKGRLVNGPDIAIKRLSPGSHQGPVEFTNEISLIAQVQHINLVRVLGFCVEGNEKLILYEFMSNGSLDSFIFDHTKKKSLDWPKRFHIAIGIATGLLYLHRYSRLKIIHRDLKAGNILLDCDLVPKISDFGLARIFERNEFQTKTNRIVGTLGYMPPEYLTGGHFSDKTDIFSFGVLLLEIVSGMKSISFYNSEQALTLVEYAWNLWKDGRVLEFIDPVLVGTTNASEVTRCIHVGLLCVQKTAAERPDMSSVLFMLSGELEAETFPSPRSPAFSWEIAESVKKDPLNCSNNEVTISVIDGR